MLVFADSAFAQGFPGGGGGMHGNHGPPTSDSPRTTSPAPDIGKPFDPLEALLRTAHELRQTLVLDTAQMQRWAEMQADLRDAVEKRRPLMIRPSGNSQVANPTLLFVQDMADGESAFAQSLAKLSTSMQAAFEALDERQKKMFVDRMTGALNHGPAP
jgi:hypothetical protein